MVSFRMIAHEMHARSFLEAMDGNHKSHAGGVKVKVPACLIDSKTFKGNEGLVAISWCKATAKCSIQSPSAIIDRSAEVVQKLWEVYDRWLTDKEVAQIATALKVHD